MTKLSNSLADLAERVKAANTAAEVAEATAIAKALETGALLVEAKAACAHGEWLPFLERAGIHERQARRLMQLVRAGLKSDTVSDLGGVKAALAWCQNLRLPDRNECLCVTVDEKGWQGTGAMAFIYQEGGGYHVRMIDVNEASPHSVCTERPLLDERAVWLSLYQTLDYRMAEMNFSVLAWPGSVKEITHGIAA
jgi:hypothetical protein